MGQNITDRAYDDAEYPMVELGQILEYRQPTKYLVKSTNYKNEYRTPVLTAGKSFLLGYTDDEDGIFPVDNLPVIIFDDFTTATKYVDFPFKVKSSAMKILKAKDDIDIRFVFYMMQTIKFSASQHKRYWISEYSKIKIPLPPLDIQKQLANTLDNFTRLEAELEAELEARKKQYAHYRAKLLTFGDEIRGGVSLGQVGVLIRGNGLLKKDFTESGIGCIHYGQIYTHYGTFTDKTKSFISPELAKKLKKANKGDLIIASTSEDIEGICKAVAWLGDEEIVAGGDTTILKHGQNPKYLSYYFQTPMFFDQKRKFARGTKVMHISAKDMAKIKIPLPNLDEQERIVSVLDRFDALVNDISIGLPAELKARRKQYEYYRDKLLTFNEYAS